MMGALEGALRPPRAWEVMLRGLHGIMNGFGRLSFLVDENTAAMHFFVSALLTLCDRYSTISPTLSLPSLCHGYYFQLTMSHPALILRRLLVSFLGSIR